MYKTGLAVFAILASGGLAMAGPPPDEMVQKLTKAIRKHCPDAKIEVTGEGFVAKFGTMKFTLHGRSKSGEVLPVTYQEEGPNFKGFILRVALQDGKYEGAAVVPQTLQGPYFPTFIDGPPADGGRKHYLVGFSYGSRLDPGLKKSIFEAMPRSTPRAASSPDADPPRPAVKPAVKKLFGLRAPGGWMLDIHDDGSGRLGFGASLGDKVPAGTFKPGDVRKALDRARLDPKGSESSHFIVWYEAERKAPDDGPPARYTQDEKVIVPLFEKAAEAREGKVGDRVWESLGKKRPAFGLKK